MKSKTVKSFSEWYEDEGTLSQPKPKSINKRSEMRKEVALKRGDVDLYLDEEDWDS